MYHVCVSLFNTMFWCQSTLDISLHGYSRAWSSMGHKSQSVSSTTRSYVVPKKQVIINNPGMCQSIYRLDDGSEVKNPRAV